MAAGKGFTPSKNPKKRSFKSTSRVDELKKRIRKAKTTDPEELMMIIMDTFQGDEVMYPEVGKFYTFVYLAKTPKIVYDQHPLIACTHLYAWGFKGTNFHWEETRSYTWNEVIGKIFVVEYQELDELLSIPYMKIRINK